MTLAVVPPTTKKNPHPHLFGIIFTFSRNPVLLGNRVAKDHTETNVLHVEDSESGRSLLHFDFWLGMRHAGPVSKLLSVDQATALERKTTWVFLLCLIV